MKKFHISCSDEQLRVFVTYSLTYVRSEETLFLKSSFNFCPRRNLNSVEDYSSSSVGVVCRVSNLKDGIFSKRFELEG